MNNQENPSGSLYGWVDDYEKEDGELKFDVVVVIDEHDVTHESFSCARFGKPVIGASVEVIDVEDPDGTHHHEPRRAG